jgi:hypothetical protein
MEVFTAATLAALVLKVTSFTKYVIAGQLRQALTQAVPWGVGMGGVWVAAQSMVAENMRIWGEVSLGQLDGWSIVLAGLALGSFGSFGYDVKKAVDNTDSAAEPPLGR